jgi:hypothetical protein
MKFLRSQNWVFAVRREPYVFDFLLSKPKEADLSEFKDLFGPELEARRKERDSARLEQLNQLLADKAQLKEERDRVMPQKDAIKAEAEANEKSCRDALAAAVARRVASDLDRFGSSAEFAARLSRKESSLPTLNRSRRGELRSGSLSMKPSVYERRSCQKQK